MVSRINSIKSDSFVITGVTLWGAEDPQHSSGKPHDIYVQDGFVTKIAASSGGTVSRGFQEISGHGLTILPAGVDAQVHLRVPGQPTKETASSGLWAAVRGGIGALLTMPNTKPVLDHPDVCALARAELLHAENQTGVDVCLSAAITMNQKGKELVDFEGLRRAGVVAFTDDGVGVADDQIMLEALKGVARTGLPLLQHAEVPGHGAVLAPGPVQKQVGGAAYPESAETDMVERDLRLLAGVPEARYHVLHVSSAKTLELVKKARQQGLRVTCEASPHHLFFTSDNIESQNTSFKMNPPLRGAADREALQIALENGDCDFMATDHAPHEKDVKSSNFKTSAFGTTGLETSLQVLLWLWQRGRLSTSRLVETWAKAPAEFLGISHSFGSIGVGRPFHAVLIDPHAPDRCVMEEDFESLSKNSCFIGSALPGKIYKTFLKTWIHEVNN